MLTSLRHDLTQKSADVRMVYAQRDEQVKAIAELECTVQELEDDQDEVAQTRDRLVSDLADVEKQIASKERELNEILPKLAAVQDKEAKVKHL